MRTVLKGTPIAAPLDRHTHLSGCLFYRRSNAVEQGPIPPHSTADPWGDIHSMAGQVAGIERLGRTGRYQLPLPGQCPYPLDDRKIHRGELDGPLHHPDKVWVNPLQPAQRPGPKNKTSHQAIRMMAVVLAAAGKTMVKSPSVEVLSEPKSSTATAALVRVVLAFEFAEGVLL